MPCAPEIIDEKGVLKGDLVRRLLREADELVAIFVASIRTAKGDA